MQQLNFKSWNSSLVKRCMLIHLSITEFTKWPQVHQLKGNMPRYLSCTLQPQWMVTSEPKCTRKLTVWGIWWSELEGCIWVSRWANATTSQHSSNLPWKIKLKYWKPHALIQRIVMSVRYPSVPGTAVLWTVLETATTASSTTIVVDTTTITTIATTTSTTTITPTRNISGKTTVSKNHPEWWWPNDSNHHK